MKAIQILLYFLIGLLILTSNSLAATMQPCGSNDNISGKKFKVSGSGINVRVGPGTNYEKVINHKASQILKKTHYVSIDESVTVVEECTNGEWSKIQVIDPDYLNTSHRGWVASKFLIKPKNIQNNGNWYSEWSSEFHMGIVKTLSANNIRGCGEFRFRENMSDRTDFLVKCTADGRNWVQYRVSTSKNTVKKHN